MRWTPPPATTVPDTAAAAALPPSLWVAVRRGIANRCPVCGEGRLFQGYLKIVPACAVCGTELGRLRADDAPPYFTIFIAGHLLVPGVLMIEKAYMPPMWLHMVVWLPFFAILCTLLLRPVKGAVVGWMLMLGIDGGGPTPALPPAEAPRGTGRDA